MGGNDDETDPGEVVEDKPLVTDKAFDSGDTIDTGAGGRIAATLASLSSTTTQVDPPVDLKATIATKQEAVPAELIRDRAVDMRRDIDELETISRPPGTEAPRAVDVNATIVTQRARSAAEQERDLAFEKLRDGTADELRSDRKPAAATGGKPATKRNRMADGLPWLVTKAVQIRGERSRPDEDSGVTTHGTGNEMRGTINRPGHDHSPPIEGEDRALGVPPGEESDEGRALRLHPARSEPDGKDTEPDDHALAGRGPRSKRAAPDDDEHAETADHELALAGRLHKTGALMGPREGADLDEDEAEAHMGTMRDRPWWQRWQYLVPLGALAAVAGIALVVIQRDAPAPRRALTGSRDAGTVESKDHAPTPRLDGEPVELGEIPSDLLEANEADPTIFNDENPEADATDSILPIPDYGWLETLDEDGLARAESWLARKRL